MNTKRLKNDIKANKPALIIIAAYALWSIFFHIPLCPYRVILGIPCPGCGATRGLKQLLTLHFGKAFAAYPCIYIIVPYVICFFFFRYFTKNDHKKLFDRLLWVILILIIIAYIIRMILYFPNTEPMVFNENSVLGFILKHTP